MPINPKSQKSFTLLEILVAVGIMAIMGSIISLVLNPTEILRKTRDTARMADLQQLNRAIANSLGISPGLGLGTANIVYISLPDNSSSTCGSWGLPALPSGYQYNCVSQDNLKKVNGQGWVPVNFSSLGTGSPLSVLPTDPINTSSSGQYYSYIPGGSWELNGILESERYRNDPSVIKQNFPGVLSYGSNKNLSPLFNSSGLVGYWKFDEGSGTTARDSSGNGNNGAMYSSTTLTNLYALSGCKIGSCASFDGVDDNIIIGDPNILRINGDITITAWVKTANNSKNEMTIFVSLNSVIHRNYQLLLNAGILRFMHGNGSISANYNSNISIADNNFNLVAFTADFPNYYFFVNGMQRATDAMTFDIIAQSGPRRMSGNPSWPSTIWDGLIDEVRVYNRALSAAEIMALYNATK